MKTAKELGITLDGKLLPCIHCAKAKGRQANVKKYTHTRSDTAAERLFFDIASIKTRSKSGSKFWLLVIDDYTRMKWSYFLPTKAALKYKMEDLLQQLEASNKQKIRYLRCDNAGENKAFQKACIKQGRDIEFEFTST